MSELYEFHAHPDLESPVLILALEGWIDAGRAGARDAAAILEGAETALVVSFDTDLLLDHRSRRPVMHLRDGLNTGLTWPSIEMHAFADSSGNEVLMLTGAEPDHRWRAFTNAVVDLALEFGVRQVVGVGAYPAPVPHTRPPLLATTATDAALAAQVGSVRSNIDVPSGIGGAIEERCAEVGLPAVGLWAQVPHYAATMPYPAASLALVEAVNDLAQMSVPTGTLAQEANETGARLDELVADSPEHVALLRQLEEQADASGDGGLERTDGPGSEGPLPTGEELASEIERFLRGQGDR